MEFVVYSDESHQDEAAKHRYMSLGGLWVPADRKSELTMAFKAVAKSGHVNSEVKWQKTSDRCLESYRRIIDFFADESDLRMRVIVVDQQLVNPVKFHDGDFELAFYKFYYQLLHQWMRSDDRYLVLLDSKSNQGEMRLLDLRRVLANKLGSTACIKDVLPVHSAETPLMQLADLLTGAVAAAWCQELSPESAKSALIAHIEQRLYRTLRVPDSAPITNKLNIFKIRLR